MKRPVAIEDLLRIVDVEDPQISPDERWIAYIQRSIHRLENSYKTNLFIVSTQSDEAPIQLSFSGSDSQPRWSPDGRHIAFVSARSGKPQIYLLRIASPGGEAQALTSMSQGASQPRWSPDGQHIAFLSALDEAERAAEARGETPLPPADLLEARHRRERHADDEARRFDPMLVWRVPYRDGYGRTYMDGRYQQLYIVAAQPGASPRRLTDLDADFAAPCWTPDSQALLTWRPSEHLADEPSRFDSLYRIPVDGGPAQRLQDEPYAQRNPVISPDGSTIAYIRTPQDKLYTRVPLLAMMPAEGGPGTDLSLSADRSALDPRWAPDGQRILFRMHSEGSTALYEVNPQTHEISLVIAAEAGDFIEVQGYDISPLGGIAYTASTPERLAELFWHPAGASSPTQLTQVNQPLYDSLIVQPTTELRYTSHDDSSVQGWYILPPDYEAGKRYPLIVNIHGGPRIMYSPASKMWHEWQYLAGQGYIVFFCNAHGSDGYGQAYQAKSYGDVDMPDHMAGVDLLIERGFVDPDRMAVWGGSYGGYMTGWVITHTDRFAAAIAERGVYNLLSHYGTTDFPFPTPQEFDGEPWEKPMLLWDYSPLAHAHKITTPTLLIHSENDYRVLISEAEQLFSYIRLSGGTVQMLRFPREGHGLSRNGEPEHRIIRMQHIINWFDRYCKA